LLVVVFAAAMAWVESAAVFYLRVKLDRIVPLQANPLPYPAPVGWLSFGLVELVREAATLIMLVAIGWLAGQTARSRLGYTLVAFGAWDILYYVFLVPISGWPQSVWDWDVLFLLPTVWWGPVLAPMLIAALMVIGGTLVSLFALWPRWWTMALNGLGVALALFVFMSDALQALAAGGGAEAVRNVEPQWFNWPLFLAALALLAAPVVDVAHQLLAPERRPSNLDQFA
jgi:hypothetical protein